MSKLVLLVEEYSMTVLLKGLLPRLFPELSFVCVTHEGKHDLEKSIPRKLRAWREPGVRFIVLRDNDGADCVKLKAGLIELCDAGGRPDTVVRIVCQELEAWYLGEPEALAVAFGDEALAGLAEKARFRDPDSVRNPGAALTLLAPSFQKVLGARQLASCLTVTRNRSRSFQVFVESVRQHSVQQQGDR